MPSRDPDERVLVARIAAAERWGRTTDRTAATARARAALWQSFLDKADPDHVLDMNERTKRALNLEKAHMTRLALRAAQARRREREAREAATTTPPEGGAA